jgi:hypothetical protein
MATEATEETVTISAPNIQRVEFQIVGTERMRQMKELARVTGDRKYKRGKGRRNWN